MIQHLNIILWIVCVFALTSTIDSCGILTHLIIGQRAKANYNSISTKHNYIELVDRHRDAFYAGSAFPDAFEYEGCVNGSYRDVADDTHWAPFLNATINYIRKLPQPWDNGTEKLVAFTFGIASHQVADILWDSSGIEQGFLSTMANVNFHGSIDDAAQAAYLGGDAVNMFFMDVRFFDDFTEWYVPADDLVNIYKDFYGVDKIGKTVIENCSSLQFTYAVAEQYGIAELYPEVSEVSPFLVDHQTDYFIGGLDDMTIWSQRIWNDSEIMLENGTDKCTIPKNSLFIDCGNKGKKFSTVNTRRHSSTLKDKYNVTLKDVDIERKHRGLSIRPGSKLKEKLRRGSIKTESNRDVDVRNGFACTTDLAFNVYVVNNSYSNFGWSMLVKDIDADGNDDIIVGAPRYSAVDNVSGHGRVNIVYGSDNGFLMCDGQFMNVNDYKNNFTTEIFSPLSKIDSGFGSSVAVVDINLDGVLDLAIGASLTGKEILQYNGAVYIFFGKANSRNYVNPDITISCESKYCNLGYTLAVSDVNFDGKDDLVIGTPLYQIPNPQTGIVSALVANSSYTGLKSFKFEDLIQEWSLRAKQGYGWFGHKIRAKYNVLMISQPHYRRCGRPDCTISSNDTQSVGRLNVYNMGSKVKMSNFTVTGSEEFQSLGYSSDLGYPFGDGSLILAVGIPRSNVTGSILTVPFQFSQAGVVVLYNITSSGPVEITRFEGNRPHARFGAFVKFEDVNGDDADDLIISAPHSPGGVSPLLLDRDVRGMVYIYNGGKTFPMGTTNTSICSEAEITPCTGRQAITWDSLEGAKNLFGFEVAAVKTTKHWHRIAFTAPYGSNLQPQGDSNYKALSGMVYLN